MCIQKSTNKVHFDVNQNSKPAIKIKIGLLYTAQYWKS